MKNPRKRIFLTGATGIMGWAGLQQLLAENRHDITLLARPSNTNRRKLKALERRTGVRIVWGDLTCYDDVLRGVEGADYVLHVGGMVPPRADHAPEATMRTNITAAEHIVRAIRAQPNADEIRLVYIGSVAQTSERNPPVHWGRTGDPICISTFDYYGLSKTIAERTIVESGLRRWVSLRQSGILYPGIFRNFDPIIFRVPLQGVLEWTTLEDSARLLARVCDEEVPDTFWNRFYHVSSGPTYRLTNYEFERLLLQNISVPPPEKVFEPKWFALRNFHGFWFTDADRLEAILHFRAHIPCDEYMRRLRKEVPALFRLARFVPASVIKTFMRRLASTPKEGTLDWIKNDDSPRISAYFGSRERWERIPDWAHFDRSRPSDTPHELSHGYDETLPENSLGIEEMRSAAAFRGGRCLSQQMTPGDLTTKLQWECHAGHRFEASPALILLGGHWCPSCLPTPWHYDEEARHNPFLAQVWHASHHSDENHEYRE